MNLTFIGIAAGGYAAAAILGGLWLGARDDLAHEIEACNTRAVAAVAESERAVRVELESAHNEEKERLRVIARQQQEARIIVSEALREAESKPERVRTVIKEVPREELAGQCLDMPMPDNVALGLRN